MSLCCCYLYTVSPLPDDYAFEPHLPPIVEGNDEKPAETEAAAAAAAVEQEEELEGQEDNEAEDATSANVSVRERSTSGPGKKNNKKVA